MTAPDYEPAMRRVCVAVDMERYSANVGGVAQVRAQAGLTRVIAAAADQSGVDRVAWIKQPAGDGEVALLPPGIDEPEFVARFVRGLKIALTKHNNESLPRIRLRVALDEGLVWMADNGFAGNVIVDVSRLCNSPVAREKLREHQEVDLVLLVSSCLYRDLQGYEYHDLPPRSFERVDIAMPEKGFEASAWVHLDVLGPAATPAPDGRSTPGSRSSGEAGTVIHGNQITVHGDQVNAGRDVNTAETMYIGRYQGEPSA